MIGCYDTNAKTRKLKIITMQNDLWILLKINYYFVHDVLKKIVLGPNLSHENCKFWLIAHDEDREGSTMTGIERYEAGMMTQGWRQMENTEDGIIFFGGRM